MHARVNGYFSKRQANNSQRSVHDRCHTIGQRATIRHDSVARSDDASRRRNLERKRPRRDRVVPEMGARRDVEQPTTTNEMFASATGQCAACARTGSYFLVSSSSSSSSSKKRRSLSLFTPGRRHHRQAIKKRQRRWHFTAQWRLRTPGLPPSIYRPQHSHSGHVGTRRRLAAVWRIDGAVSQRIGWPWPVGASRWRKTTGEGTHPIWAHGARETRALVMVEHGRMRLLIGDERADIVWEHRAAVAVAVRWLMAFR